MMKYHCFYFLAGAIWLMSCSAPHKHAGEGIDLQAPYIVVLGTVQDAGSPQIGCDKACCKALHTSPDKDRMVVSLGLVDPVHGKSWLLEATPDLPRQLAILNETMQAPPGQLPDGIFITHAHIGHYTGLMYLGREAINASSAQVYAMPRLAGYLQSNGPWSQLVNLKNIALQPLVADSAVRLAEEIEITPFVVPHRDEFSETVGYRITGPRKKALFIPDIDKWAKWERDITEEISQVDYAFVDATFYDAAEINYRDISTIPHPFVSESMQLFDGLPGSEKSKIHFIHFNHTNPLLNPNSKETKDLLKKGYRIAQVRDRFDL